MSQSDVRPRPGVADGTARVSEASWRGLYRLGGILAIVTAFLWLVLAQMGATLYRSGFPSSPAAYLQLISQSQSLASATWILWDIADFILIIPTAALYLVLRRRSRTAALVGAILQGFFIFYDISVTELNSLTLVSLSQGYAASTTDAARTAYLAAATYGYAALPIQTVLSFGVGTFGFLLWCYPMARGIFGRRIALLGAAVNMVGVLGAFSPVLPASALLAYFQFATLPAVALWLIVVGGRLYRRSDQIAAMDGAANQLAPVAGVGHQSGQ